MPFRLWPGILALAVLTHQPCFPQQLAATPVTTSAPAYPWVEDLDRATDLFRHAKFAEADTVYQSIVSRYPDAVPAYVGLARSELREQKIPAALEAARKAVDKDDESALAHTALGEVLFRHGDMEDSEKEFIRAIQIDSHAARAYLGLARLYDAYSLHHRAYLDALRAHEFDPTDPDITRRWMAMLPLAQRIAELQKFLDAPNALDEEMRESMQRYLAILKERQEHPRKGCRLVTNIERTETPLAPMLIDANRVRGWGLKVLLNGHPSKLFLDTGASGILVSRKLAEKAKLVSVADTKIGGIGDKGLTGGHIAYADSIKVGDLEFQNCMVEISDKKEVADEDGLIGADVFERYLVDIDLANRKLRLSPLPKRPGESDTNAALKTSDDEDAEAAGAAPADKEKGDAATHNQTAAAAATQRVPQDGYIAPEMQSYTKVFRFGHELLIRTRVNESSPKLFLIDTGSQMTLISPDAAREVTKVHGENHVRVQGLNGNVRNVYSADKAILQFSHLRQENDDIISFDLSNLSKHTGTEISGVLGFTTLGLLDMKIDYRDGLVDFSYDEARWRRFR